jgi:hypothetical protein
MMLIAKRPSSAVSVLAKLAKCQDFLVHEPVGIC